MPADARVRRRRLAVAGIAAAALLTGVAVGADDPDRPERSVVAARPVAAPEPTVSPAEASRFEKRVRAAQRLPVAELAGSVVILRFNGASVPPHVERALRRGWAAGAIIFPDNAPSPAGLRAVTRRLHRAAGGRAIIGTDQEGGRVRRLPWAAPAAAQPSRGTEAEAAAAARQSGRDLRAVGLNVTFAPVGDLPQGFMRGRAFPGGPAAVARLTSAAVRGYSGTGVAPTVKHFPGLGGATANTDDAPSTVSRSARDIGALDLPPFRAAIKAQTPLIMLSHARYPALDSRNIASQSKAISTDLLRKRLGFKGVAVTDSLEARAVTTLSGPGTAAVRSVRAGADLILLTGPGSHLRVVRALAAEARRSRSFRRRLAEASARVAPLRGRTGS
jgi:beta-N-acetylhexosaminidase